LTGPLVSLVQARMSSGRLPGKVLLPLGDGTVLDQVVRRAAAFSSQVVVCTSQDASDDPLEAHCARTGTLCVRGALHDVFLRFRDALLDARVEKGEWFARITADCPLVSVPLARRLLEAAEADPELDYVCEHLDRLPRGLAIEVVRRDTFLSIPPESLDDPQSEHVTLVLYENPQRYRCLRLTPPAPLRHPELRLTLDYPDDYALLRRLYEEPEVTAESAVARLLADPALRGINAHCDQRALRGERAPGEVAR
jgi:spore coat polysaccharide biosynthesis protein SpsF